MDNILENIRFIFQLPIPIANLVSNHVFLVRKHFRIISKFLPKDTIQNKINYNSKAQGVRVFYAVVIICQDLKR